LPEPALPARSRIPAITGAEGSVLIMVARGDNPLRSTCAGDLGVPVGGALFGVAVDRAQQRAMSMNACWQRDDDGDHNRCSAST
jgi:hypothetical protein